MIDGRARIPLRRLRGRARLVLELRRESSLPKPTRQTNVSFSRAGRIRGLHYHERGQDDLFVLPPGDGPRRRARPGDRRDLHARHRRRQPGRRLRPGPLAHGFEALTDLLFLYHVTEEYDPADPDEHGVPWDDPRVVDLWSTRSPILSERDAAAAS